MKLYGRGMTALQVAGKPQVGGRATSKFARGDGRPAEREHKVPEESVGVTTTGVRVGTLLAPWKTPYNEQIVTR